MKVTADIGDLIAKHEIFLRRVAFHYTKNTIVAEYLLEDTRVKIWSCLETLDRDSHFKVWATGLMRHLFIHGYRKQKRKQKIEEPAGRF